jgi:hypothetical protein
MDDGNAQEDVSVGTDADVRGILLMPLMSSKFIITILTSSFSFLTGATRTLHKKLLPSYYL